MEKNFGSRKGSVIAVDTDTFGLNRKDELLIIFSLLQNMQNSSVKHSKSQFTCPGFQMS